MRLNEIAAIHFATRLVIKLVAWAVVASLLAGCGGGSEDSTENIISNPPPAPEDGVNGKEGQGEPVINDPGHIARFLGSQKAWRRVLW